MDQFISIKRDASTSGFIGDVTIFNEIATAIDDNILVCVYGPGGAGKTYMVQLALKNKNWVEVTTTKDIPTLSDSACHVVIDSDKIDKSIIEHDGKLSFGSTILISKNAVNIGNCKCIEVPKPSMDDMISICKKLHPKMKIEHISHCAKKCDGDIRALLFSLQFNDNRDVFKTSKEYIFDLLKKGGSNAYEHINKDVSDHGYIWDIVFTNYAHNGLNNDIAQSLSDADVYDTRIYGNSWELMDHFWVSGVIYPLCNMKGPICESKLKPGSAWTKFSNFKMKEKRLKSLPSIDMCNHITKIMSIAPHDDVINILRSYNIKAKDIDILNSLNLFTKIPIKKIKKIKTDLTASYS
jgi:hypothetical protein